MKFTFNIEKKHFYFISVLITVLVAVVFVTATFNSNAPSHPLEQIVNSQGESVDKNSDGIIDDAGYAFVSGETSKLSGATLTDIQSQIASVVSSAWTISTGKIYYTGGNVGIGTSLPTSKLDVAGSIKASSLEVSGNIIAADPISANHVATKSYVDNFVVSHYNNLPTGALAGYCKENNGKIPSYYGTNVFLPAMDNGNEKCTCESGWTKIRTGSYETAKLTTTIVTTVSTTSTQVRYSCIKN